MKKPIVTVSDHAVIRYAERVMGIDMEHVRREIGRRVDRSFRDGACGVTVDGFTYRLQDGVVTTVLEASRPDLRLGRHRPEADE